MEVQILRERATTLVHTYIVQFCLKTLTSFRFVFRSHALQSHTLFHLCWRSLPTRTSERKYNVQGTARNNSSTLLFTHPARGRHQCRHHTGIQTAQATYVQRNIEARSRKHSCRGKQYALHILSVFLKPQLSSMSNACAVLSTAACPAVDCV